MRRPEVQFALSTLAVLLSTPAWALAQPAQEPIAVPGDGTELFRGLLDHAGIKPVTERELQNLLANPWDDIIFISLGNPDGAPNQRLRPLPYLQRASARGGVLIATDTHLRLQSSSNAALTINGQLVECAVPKSTHRQKPHCPYLIPMNPGEVTFSSEIFRGLKSIATNSPSFLTVQQLGGDFQHPLATFPRNSRIQDSEFRLPDDTLFAIAGEGPDEFNRQPYRLLVMADHSVFINQMLLEPGTENIELAYRTIKFLQEPNNRKRCVFFENGKLIDHFDDLRQTFGKQNQMPLPQVNLWGMQDKLTDLGNVIIDRLQANDANNKLLLGSSNPHRSLSVIARFLVILAAAMACFFLLRRAWSTRKPGDIPPPPAVAGAPSGPPGVFDRRQKELLRRNNVFEPVRDLVREFFQSIGIHSETPPKPPKLVISDVVRKPESLRAAIKDLWRIAFGPVQVMTVHRWRELEPFFERVRHAHSDAKWRFVL